MQPPPAGQRLVSGAAPVQGAQPKAAALFPLSGPRADLGRSLRSAAQLGLSQPDGPVLDVRDTAGTPDGAARAARDAIAGGARLLIGPLTGAETSAASSVATASGVPMLALTNDSSFAKPGVWVLGITPGQQVRRVVALAAAQGKTRFAAMLPAGEFGNAMETALQQAVSEAGLPPARVVRHAPGRDAIDAALKDVADYAARKAAAAPADPSAPAAVPAPPAVPVPGDPPFDALLLADTGDQLGIIAGLLQTDGIPPGSVKLMGPSLWAIPASGASALPNAWFAAPDPKSRTAFVKLYTDRFGSAPNGVADIAFDAASIARVTAQDGGFSTEAMVQPQGFAGADGVLVLYPDGRVSRGLAVFETRQSGEPEVIDPAPASLPPPRS